MLQEKKSKWVIDSAATHHICNDRKQMKGLRKLRTKESVRVGNGDYVEAEYEGTVKLQIKSKGKVRNFKLSNVLFVPDMKYSLLSIRKASEAGKKVVFDHFGCEIIDPLTGEVVGLARKVGNLYWRMTFLK